MISMLLFPKLFLYKADFLSSQVLCNSLNMPNSGNHRRFKREMFLLTGSGHKGSNKKTRPVKAEVQAQEEVQFQAHQEAIKVTLTSIMPQKWA